MAAELLDMKPRKQDVPRIKERITAGKCLLCEQQATRRGVCAAHYFAWRRAMAGKSRAERLEITSKAIRAGKLLPAGYVQRVKQPNPFLEK
jgi:hypothetical protein